VLPNLTLVHILGSKPVNRPLYHVHSMNVLSEMLVSHVTQSFRSMELLEYTKTVFRTFGNITSAAK